MLKHVVLLFGEDSFQVQGKLHQWRQAFVEKYGGDINVDEVEGTLAPHELLSLTQTIPFLSEKRLVIVKNFLREQDKEDLKKFAEALEKIPESCTLIFMEAETPDRRTAFFKALEKSCRLEECRPLSGTEAVQWIQNKAMTYGSSINGTNATYLHSLSPKDTWRLHNEIQKLALYAAPEEITREIIDNLTQGELEASIFKLTDAVGQKNPAEAIRLLHQLLNKGEEIPMIFGMIARQIRLLLQISDVERSGLHSSTQIAAKIKQHPYAVKMMMAQTKNFEPAELQAMHDQLLHIDRGIKTGDIKSAAPEQTEYLLAIEKLLVEGCC